MRSRNREWVADWMQARSALQGGRAIADGRGSQELTEIEQPAPVSGMPPSASPWLTVPEGGAYAKVSNGVLYAECRAGRLRHARVGGRRDIRLRREWLDAWLEASAPQEVRR